MPLLQLGWSPCKKGRTLRERARELEAQGMSANEIIAQLEEELARRMRRANALAQAKRVQENPQISK